MKLSDLCRYRITPLHFLLWPVSVLYGFFLSLKRLCYWLVDFLITQGYQPGIITRDNSDNPVLPHEITFDNDPHSADGKIFLLAHHCRASCPVWVGKDRAATAQELLSTYPACNIIICNDGMQYYRLERDIEIIVVDFSEHSSGNGLLLPAGPLRLKPNQLRESDIIVTNGKPNFHLDMSKWGKTYNMRLINDTVYNVLYPEIQRPISSFKNKQLHLLTDIDNSRWCFDYIQKMELNAELHSYAENHRFSQHEINLPEADAILINAGRKCATVQNIR